MTAAATSVKQQPAANGGFLPQGDTAVFERARRGIERLLAD